MCVKVAMWLVALGLCAGVVSADIIVHDNFGPEFSYNPNAGKTLCSFNIGTGHDRDCAMYFVPTVSGPISNFWIAINHWYSGANEFTVWLAADEGGLPGAQIGTAWEFIDMAPPMGGGPPIRGVGDGSHMLVAGEKYWLAASSVDPYADTYGVWANNTTGDESPYAKRVDLGPWELEDQSFQTRGAFRVDVPDPAYAPGDMNCDGFVDFGDINPFVQALTDPAGYEAAYPDCDIMLGDINQDESVDFGDINPFVNLLTGC